MKHFSSAAVLGWLLTLSFLPLHGQKVPIAVLDFDGIGIAESEAVALSNRLRNELFRLGRFEVVDRGNMASILNEQDFQQSGCSSNDCLVEVGRLLGAKHMVGGSVSKVGGTFTVSARLIDVETARVLAVSDFDLRGELDDMLTHGMAQVAAMLHASIASDESAPDPVAEVPVSISSTPESTPDDVSLPKQPRTPLSMPHKFKITIGMLPDRASGGNFAIGWRPAKQRKLGPVAITSFAVGFISYDDSYDDGFHIDDSYRGDTFYFLAEKSIGVRLGPVGLGMQIGLGLGSTREWWNEILQFDKVGIITSLGLSANIRLGRFRIYLGPGAIFGNGAGESIINFEIR